MTIRDTIDLGGRRTVHRLGFGAMRLTGDGIWGPPDDPDEVRAVLRRAVESPALASIPGTSSVAHREENMAPADLTLDDAQLAQLDAAVRQ